MDEKRLVPVIEKEIQFHSSKAWLSPVSLVFFCNILMSIVPWMPCYCCERVVNNGYVFIKCVEKGA